MKWKLIIEVCCLSPDLKNDQDKLRFLHRTIVDSVSDLHILDIKSEHDLMVLFPTDLMELGAGEFIYIRVRKPGARMDNPTRGTLSRALEEEISQLFPEARTIECDILD